MIKNAIIRKTGADLVVEVTAIDPITGNGVNLVSGDPADAQVSIEKRNAVNLYWNVGAPNAFDSGPELFNNLIHVRNGLHQFVLTGAAEAVRVAYRIGAKVINNGDLNINAVFSDVISEAAGDATIANQTAIAAQNVAILAEGGPGPWTGGTPVTLEDNAANTAIVQKVWDAAKTAHTLPGSFGVGVTADLTQIAGSALIDGVSITLFYEIALAYMSGRFKINFPAPGDITFYRQNNSSSLYVMHIVAGERTRL